MTSNERKFYDLCKKYSIEYHRTNDSSKLETKQEYVDSNQYYMLQYSFFRDELYIAKDVKLFVKSDAIGYKGSCLFSIQKFIGILGKYNRFKLQLKLRKNNERLEKMNEDF
jgi:hypothetical protein